MPVDTSGQGIRSWKLEDAKARFSELVRTARESGPQRVTVRGEGAVVVISMADYARLEAASMPPPAQVPFVSLFEAFSRGPDAGSIEFEVIREPGLWREPEPF